MSHDPFDDVDRALASGLSDLAPEVRSDSVLAAARPRFERARKRARVAKAGGTLVALLTVGSVAALTVPHDGRTHVSVGSGGTAPGSTLPSDRSTSTSASTTTTAPARPAIRVVPGGAASSVPVRNGPTAPGTIPATAPGSIAGGGPGPAGGSGPGRGGSATTTTPPNPNDVQTYRATGGSISVRLSGGTATLVRVTADAGYGYMVHDNGPSRVEVRFTLGGQEASRIDLRVENGHLVRSDQGG